MSNRFDEMRKLANAKRNEFSISTHEINLASIRAIYKQLNIKIDSNRGKLRKIKAAYFCGEYGCSVLLNMQLPVEPRLFAMIHELKHHFVDQEVIMCACTEIHDSSPLIEIGAEVFAAEFLFPDKELKPYIDSFANGNTITPEHVVKMKKNSPVQVSFQFFCKSLARLGYIKKGQFDKIKIKKLFDSVYGIPFYRKRKK